MDYVPEVDSQTLLDTARYISEHGWVQRTYEVRQEVVDAYARLVADGIALGEQASFPTKRVGSVCAVGGLMKVFEQRASVHNGMTLEGMDLLEDTLEAFASVIVKAAKIERKAGIGFTCLDELVAWNDAEGRCAEDVIIALEQAAASLKTEAVEEVSE